MNFEELDETTRKYMLQEFQAEEKSGNPYRSDTMTAEGLSNVVQIVEKALTEGNEITLARDLARPSYWKPTTTSHRGNTVYQRKINPETAASVFALGEFNTWYVRGLAKKLMEEGQTLCEIYRAESAAQPRCECSVYEGKPIELSKIYAGHRVKYHPVKNNSAFSIPSGPNCHHAIRRIK